MKKIIAVLSSVLCLLIPCAVFADDPLPERGISRIKWSIENSGSMPGIMLIGLIAIAVMIIITVFLAKYYGTKEDGRNEQQKK